MTQPLGFGFIGAGAIANFHARAVAAAQRRPLRRAW